MSTRFFQSIRRNQKQWMVVVTVLSMVSFLFLDDLGRGKGPTSGFGGGLIIGSLCAAAMCIIGYGRQKTAEFGIGGFLVGFIAGFAGFSAMGQNRPVARTSIGNLTRNDFELMSRNRMRVNQFLSSVARRVKGGPGGIGGIDNQSLVSYRLLLADAKKMGIKISDEGVTEFLKAITNNRLTRQDFRESLREAGLGENELFDILKDELAARLAVQLLEPPAVVVNVRPEWARFAQTREPLRYMPQTPQQYWDAYQKLNLKQSLQAVAIPVNEFINEVDQPSDNELAEFFSKYKTFRWRDEARPGFLQLPRVQLAYFTADIEKDFEKFEDGNDPTDDEIRDYYEKNKDRYRAPAAKPSTAPLLPEGEGVSTEDSPKTDTSPDETPKSEIKAPETGTESESKPDEKVIPEEKSATENETPEKPAAPEEKGKEEPSKPESKPDEPKSESSCGEEGASEEKTNQDSAPAVPGEEVKDEKPEPAAEEKPAAEQPPATEEKPAPEEKPGVEEKPSAEASDDVPPEPETDDRPKKETTISRPADATIPSNTIPEGATAAGAPAEPKIRELDDDLKLEIKDTILRERAFSRIIAALDKAYEVMVPLGLEYDTSIDEKQKKEKEKAISQKLKDYAAQHKLEYVETSELDYDDLITMPIGMAVENEGRTSVANEVMMRGEKGESRMPLYAPRRADLRSRRTAFTYWKISDTPARVPDLKEDSVREKVLQAWKFDRARTLAEKRAQVLADKAKAGGTNFAESIAGESASGQKGDPALSVIETPQFTWLSTPRSVPGGLQDPLPSDIPLIPSAGNEFMKKVFEDLKDGEIGVVPNENRSVYYVVKVTGRESEVDDGGVAKQLRNQVFLTQQLTGLYPLTKTSYESIAEMPQRIVDQAWQADFAKRHNVEWDEDVEPSRRRR